MREHVGANALIMRAGDEPIARPSEEAYERSQRTALALLNKGFHLGGISKANRDELHER